VDLRHRHRGPVQHAPIQSPPRAVRPLHAIGNYNVSVQLRVAAATVPVIERRRDHPAGIQLRDAAIAAPGERRMLLNQRQHVGDSLVLCRHDLLLDPHIGSRPQRRNRLHRRERQVEASHRLPRLLPHLLPANPCHGALAFGVRQGRVEFADPIPDPLLRILEHAIRLAEFPACARILRTSEQRRHLSLGHLAPRHQLAVTETAETLSHPAAGRVSRSGVVRGQRRNHPPINIARPRHVEAGTGIPRRRSAGGYSARSPARNVAVVSVRLAGHASSTCEPSRALIAAASGGAGPACKRCARIEPVVSRPARLVDPRGSCCAWSQRLHLFIETRQNCANRGR
jgi:hypothetical protein